MEKIEFSLALPLQSSLINCGLSILAAKLHYSLSCSHSACALQSSCLSSPQSPLLFGLSFDGLWKLQQETRTYQSTNATQRVQVSVDFSFPVVF